ncbi:MAG TPA: cytochrome P450 [Solirubrobacteraceae bacterium]|nr:cytochrome P450 [Solirubrobacteraceae bacterium]
MPVAPAKLPPGPRRPTSIQTLGWWARPIPFLERARARYGRRFTIRLLGQVPFVMISDPDEVRELFTAPPDVLHPGEGARILEPVLGRNSVILLDEGEHLEQRKLMLPAFHGEKMQRLSELMDAVSRREAESWPQGEPIALHPRLQSLTLEIILRAVFGLDPGPRLDRLRERLTQILSLGTKPFSLLPAQRGLGGRGPWARLMALRDEADALIFALIDERRRDPGERDDVLAMLLEARHEDGSEMSRQELRDELMTLLVAGHETTASQLAWTFERLVRTPAALERLAEEVREGDEEDGYLDATIQESLRRRPVLGNAAPRFARQPVDVGDWHYPEGVCLVANAYLLHHDPAIYPDPYAFRPERFLEEPPGTYTWIPFGGGRRRCLGASFAQLEMRIVLRAVLSRHDVIPAARAAEPTRRRSITFSPGDGALAVLRARTREPVPA